MFEVDTFIVSYSSEQFIRLFFEAQVECVINNYSKQKIVLNYFVCIF